ncbi:MAG: hypothetical protein ACK4TA_16570 [Saprospiraceae bacterium]
MKYLLQVFILIVTLSLIACRQNPSNEGEGASTSTPQEYADTTGRGIAVRDTHNCTVKGEVLEGNLFWARDQEVLVAITADSTTYSADLDAPGHRILEIYDTKNCSLIQRQVLPVDESPDFPYYISDITYNNVTHLVGIRGTSSIYLYDVASRKLLPRMKPQFATKRPGIDAQSGMVQRLEVWENYLVGYAQDYGAFVYNMTNAQNPTPVMPLGEYKVQDGEYGSLFLLPAGTGNAEQGIMPSYDRETGEFKVNTIFDQPIDINTAQVNKSALNNRYIVLRNTADNTAYAVDLQAQKRIDLPADIAAKPTQEILSWVRKNR